MLTPVDSVAMARKDAKLASNLDFMKDTWQMFLGDVRSAAMRSPGEYSRRFFGKERFEREYSILKKLQFPQ